MISNTIPYSCHQYPTNVSQAVPEFGYLQYAYNTGSCSSSTGQQGNLWAYTPSSTYDATVTFSMLNYKRISIDDEILYTCVSIDNTMVYYQNYTDGGQWAAYIYTSFVPNQPDQSAFTPPFNCNGTKDDLQ
jgi:hypothetical protein